jgi:hypothetical protein
MVPGGQLILDSPNLGDDGVAYKRFLSCHSYCPKNPNHRRRLGTEDKLN